MPPSFNKAIELRMRVIGILLFPVAFFVLVSLVTYSINDYPNSSLRSDEVLNMGGHFGALVAFLLFLIFGYGAYGIPFLIVFFGWNRLNNHGLRTLLIMVGAGLGIIIAGATTASLITSFSETTRFEFSGALGLRLGQWMSEILGVNAALLTGVVTLCILIFFSGLWTLHQLHPRRRPSSQIHDDGYATSPDPGSSAS